jgi:hypothetical protein
VLAKTVIREEKDWVIWRMKPRVKSPKKVRKWVWRRLHKKEGLVSPK